MARSTVVVNIDDVTGQQVPELTTVPITLDGAVVEVDLGPETYKKYREAVGPFAGKGRRVGRVSPSGNVLRPIRGTAPARTDREQTKAIREWWQRNAGRGNVPPTNGGKGRIPGEVSDLYDQHGGRDLPAPEPVEATDEPKPVARKRAAKKAAAS